MVSFSLKQFLGICLGQFEDAWAYFLLSIMFLDRFFFLMRYLSMIKITSSISSRNTAGNAPYPPSCPRSTCPVLMRPLTVKQLTILSTMFLHYCGGGRQNTFHFKIKYYVIKYFSTKLGTLFIYHLTPFYKTFTALLPEVIALLKLPKGTFLI